MRQPEISIGTWRAAPKDAPDLTEDETQGMSLSLLKLVDRSLLGWNVMPRLYGVQYLK